MHWLVPEPTQKYESSHPRPCRNIDISWDGLQFLCIGLCQSLLKSLSYPIADHAEKLMLAETAFNFYALACAGAYSKVWVIASQTMQKNWYSWDGLQFLCIGLCRSLFKKYELSHPTCRKIDISWDGLQFLCIGLCRSLLKSMSYPIPDNADKIDISWDGFQFLCIGSYRSLLKSMSYPIPVHAEKVILAETVFNFYALACAGAYSKVWVIPSQTMQNNWY